MTNGVTESVFLSAMSELGSFVQVCAVMSCLCVGLLLVGLVVMRSRGGGLLLCLVLVAGVASATDEAIVDAIEGMEVELGGKLDSLIAWGEDNPLQPDLGDIKNAVGNAVIALWTNGATLVEINGFIQDVLSEVQFAGEQLEEQTWIQDQIRDAVANVLIPELMDQGYTLDQILAALGDANATLGGIHDDTTSISSGVWGIVDNDAVREQQLQLIMEALAEVRQQMSDLNAAVVGGIGVSGPGGGAVSVQAGGSSVGPNGEFLTFDSTLNTGMAALLERWDAAVAGTGPLYVVITNESGATLGESTGEVAQADDEEEQEATEVAATNLADTLTAVQSNKLELTSKQIELFGVVEHIVNRSVRFPELGSRSAFVLSIPTPGLVSLLTGLPETLDFTWDLSGLYPVESVRAVLVIALGAWFVWGIVWVIGSNVG